MPKLLLSTPRLDPAKSSRQLKVKHIEQWLQQLPLLNFKRSISEITEKLDLIAETPMSNTQRLGLLEATFSVIRSISEVLEDDPSFLTPTNEQGDTTRHYQLLLESFANGYKQLITAQLDSSGERLTQPDHWHTLYQLIQVLILNVQHAHRFSLPISPFVHLEINQLYQCARDSFTGQVHSGGDAADLFTKVINLFRSFYLYLIFRQTAFQQVRPEHLLKVAKQFQQLLVIGQPPSNLSPDHTHFLLDLTGDETPKSCGAMSSNAITSASSHSLIINLHDLIAELSNTLYKNVELSANPLFSLYKNNFFDFVASLTARPMRQHARIDPSTESAIHYILEVETIYRLLTTKPSDNDHQHLAQGLLSNQSSTGFQLQSMGVAHSHLLPGQLVGYLLPATHRKLRVGIIRWSKDSSTFKSNIGIEIIPGRIAPVSITLSRYFKLKCLFISHQQANEQTIRSIIIPSHSIDTTQHYLMETDGRKYHVLFGNALISTSYFSQLLLSEILPASEK